jgi:hypothetical protein
VQSKKEKKRKGVKGSKIEDFILYLSHRKAVLSRGMHQKSFVRDRGVYPFKSQIFKFHWTSPVNHRLPKTLDRTLESPTELVQSKDRLPETSYRLPEAITRLVRSGTSLQKLSTDFQRGPSNLSGERFLQRLFWGEAPHPLPWAIGQSENEAPLWDPKLDLLPLSLRLQSSFLILERRFKLPWVSHLQARAPHPLSQQPHCICYS